MEHIALAALSARPLAEAAAREGIAAVALDLFGDRDTRALTLDWRPLGQAARMRIEPPLLLDALDELAAGARCSGWVAGAGFECEPGLLEQAAARLPLIGTSPAVQRRVRDPAAFFGFLRSIGAATPETRFAPPARLQGWLLKNARSCGGWQVRRADDVGAPESVGGVPGRYWQREAEGPPMSATYIANGRVARLLGINRQFTTAVAGRPFVHAGLVGPLPAPAPLRAELQRIADEAAATFNLRGLGSIDFIAAGDTPLVLEINPRPPASLALYPRVGGLGVLGAHLAACRAGTLPPAEAGGTEPPLTGTEIVFAPRTLRLDRLAADAIAALPGACDLPQPGTEIAAGEPLCSLLVHGPSADAIAHHTRVQREALLKILEETAP